MISDLGHIITVSHVLNTNPLLDCEVWKIDEMWMQWSAYHNRTFAGYIQDGELASCGTSIDEIVPMIYTKVYMIIFGFGKFLQQIIVINCLVLWP